MNYQMKNIIANASEKSINLKLLLTQKKMKSDKWLRKKETNKQTVHKVNLVNFFMFPWCWS